jgi:hypothetical protein
VYQRWGIVLKPFSIFQHFDVGFDTAIPLPSKCLEVKPLGSTITISIILYIIYMSILLCISRIYISIYILYLHYMGLTWFNNVHRWWNLAMAGSFWQAFHKSSLRLPAGEAPSPRCNSPNSKVPLIPLIPWNRGSNWVILGYLIGYIHGLYMGYTGLYINWYTCSRIINISTHPWSSWKQLVEILLSRSSNANSSNSLCRGCISLDSFNAFVTTGIGRFLLHMSMWWKDCDMLLNGEFLLWYLEMDHAFVDKSICEYHLLIINRSCGFYNDHSLSTYLDMEILHYGIHIHSIQG